MDILIVQLKKDELILAGFRPKRGGVGFLSAERHHLEGGEGELARILSGASLAAGERKVALALPPSLLFMRELELPIADRAKVRELLPLELKGETALDTDALAYTAGNQKLYKKLRVTAVLAVAAVALLFAESGVRYYLVKRDLNSLDLSVKGIYREVFPNRKKPVDEVSELRSEIKRLEGAKTSSNLLKLLKDLADAKGDDVGGIYETEVDGLEVRLKADARSFQAANDFKARAAKVLDGAEVSEIKSRPDGSVTFNFRGKMKGVAQ